MPQVSGVLYTSQLVGVKESIVDELFELDPMDTTFLQAIGAGPNGPLNTLSRPCTQTSYQWLEVSPTSNRTALTSAINNAVTAMTLDDANWVRATDLVLIDQEIISITTVAAGQPTVIVRGAKGTSAAAHSAAAVVVVLGIPRAQGIAAPTDDFVDQPATKTNYTQIFSETVRLARTTMVTDVYGGMAEYEIAKAQKMRRLKEQLENSILFGGDATAPTAGSTASTMGGVMEYVTTNVSAKGGAKLDPADVYSSLESVYNAGGSPDLLICGSFNKRVISDWKLPHIQYQTGGAGEFGVSVNSLATDFGGPPLKVISKRSWPQTLVMILSSQNIGVGPLTASEFTHEFLGKDGDSVRGLIVGEYTCEVRLQKSHALITGTATS